MSVVYDDPQNPATPMQQSGLVGEAETHPVAAIAIVAIMAIVLGLIYQKIKGGASAASPSATQTPTTQYVPTANYFFNGTIGQPIPGPAGPAGPPGNPGQQGGGSPPTIPIVLTQASTDPATGTYYPAGSPIPPGVSTVSPVWGEYYSNPDGGFNPGAGGTYGNTGTPTPGAKAPSGGLSGPALWGSNYVRGKPLVL